MVPKEQFEVLFADKAAICSEPLRRFLFEYYRNIEFFFFVARTCTNADKARVTAAKALLGAANSEQEKSQYQKTIDEPALISKRLNEFAWIQSRNLVVTTVNTFLCYFSEIIQGAMLKRPELLKSSQQVAISEILQFRKHSEIVACLVDKKINELSYGGMREMETYLRDRLGIETFQNEEDKTLLNIFIEFRNVYTHNNGIINRLFMSRVRNPQDFSFHLGKRYHTDFDQFARLTTVCLRVAKNIDNEVIKNSDYRSGRTRNGRRLRTSLPKRKPLT